MTHIDRLLTQLQSQHWDEREQAARALGRLRDVLAVEPLIHALLHDKEWAVSIAAADSLAQLGDGRAVPALMEALPQPDPDFQIAVIKAIAQLGDAAALPALAQVLTSRYWQVRVEAVQAMGRIGDGAAVPLLEGVFTAAYPNRLWRQRVITAALEALKLIGTDEALALLARYRL